jgi:putative endonuclease
MNYIYVLQNIKDSNEFYLGCTIDLKRRVQQHNEGKSLYTKGKKWRLVYYEAYLSKSFAFKRESSLKNNARMKAFLINRIKDSLMET